jgi:hypothetical protein
VTYQYGIFITLEAKRAEDDLGAFRSRALTVVTTSAGVVTLLTGLVTFAASRVEEEAGISGLTVWLVAVALALFVLAGLLALIANVPRDVTRPSEKMLRDMFADVGWSESEADQARAVAECEVACLLSVRKLGNSVAWWLTAAIASQVVGLVFAAVAAIVMLRDMHG